MEWFWVTCRCEEGQGGNKQEKAVVLGGTASVQFMSPTTDPIPSYSIASLPQNALPPLQRDSDTAHIP